MARREWGTTLIIASHDRDWLYDVCDRVMHLFRGRLFGAGKENILFGPWHRHKGDLWEKILPDGQHIRVSEPPQPDAVAIVEPAFIAGAADLKPDDIKAHVLEGVVSRLALEKTRAEIVATILVGNLPFTSTLPPDQIQRENLYPGQKVTLHYCPDSVKWL